ncbi:hypothetical protein [Planococcus salinarum]|uniref:hypothetical protein n=1 Tax=Planococcus salinarum TaxID=622695 RepID=UPI000E3C8A58|nr:hypothetical protein [Planococcus salinarum]TAA73539.1 hypothetical protein D2909_01460 [Planococcus salinarum]
MEYTTKQKRFFISDCRNTTEPSQPFIKEGFLGMSVFCLSIFREKKIGTSVTARLSPIYSASLSPPPIRPMVEDYPNFEMPVIKNQEQNLIEECA